MKANKYQQVHYLDTVTGKASTIGAAGWKLLKAKTVKKGRKEEPRYAVLEGAQLEEYLAGRAGERKAPMKVAPVDEGKRDREALIVKALKNKIVERDGQNIVLTVPAEADGDEPTVYSAGHQEILEDAELMAKIEALVEACKTC